MKTYINTKTLEYPIFESTIRDRYKNRSWPVKFVPPADYAEVEKSDPPPTNFLFQQLVEIKPKKVDNKWVQQWQVLNLTSQEQERRLTSELYRIKQEFTSRLQSKLDSFARTRSYENITTACTYSLSSDPVYKIEGQYCLDIRDQMWKKLFEIIDDIAFGRRPFTNKFEDIESDLPKLSWPPLTA